MTTDSSSPRKVKTDINFLNQPLWMLSDRNSEGFVWSWEDGEGGSFVYRTAYIPPSKTDAIFLYFLLSYSQQNNWIQEFEISQYQVLTGCGIKPGKKWRLRLQESLERWMHLVVTFDKTFYDGQTQSRIDKTMQFHILESWSLDNTTKKLYVRFNREWLENTEHSVYYKNLVFEQLRLLKSPVAMRLFEILIKSFQQSNVFEIGAKNLARKMPLSFRYPSDIVKKIKSGINRINNQTSLQLELVLETTIEGNIKFVFHKKSELLNDGNDKHSIPPTLSNLLNLVRESERNKKSIGKLISKSLDTFDSEYLEKQILYSNIHSRRNYRAFLAKCIENNWGEDFVVAEALQNDDSQERMKRESFVDVDELKNEFEVLAEEFASLASKDELDNISERIEQEIEANYLDSEKETAFFWRMIPLLRKGIQFHQR